MDLTQLYRRGFIYRLHFDFKFPHFSYTIVQIIESRFRIVVVSSITERIVGSNCRSTAVFVCYSTIPPRVVGVTQNSTVLSKELIQMSYLCQLPHPIQSESDGGVGLFFMTFSQNNHFVTFN